MVAAVQHRDPTVIHRQSTVDDQFSEQRRDETRPEKVATHHGFARVVIMTDEEKFIR